MDPLPSITMSKALTGESNDAARRFVRRIFEEEFDSNYTKAADAIGISYTMLYDFLTEKKGAGMKLLDAVVAYEKEKGRPASLEVVLGRETPVAVEPERWVERDHVYTNLQAYLQNNKAKFGDLGEFVADIAKKRANAFGDMSEKAWDEYCTGIYNENTRPYLREAAIPKIAPPTIVTPNMAPARNPSSLKGNPNKR